MVWLLKFVAMTRKIIGKMIVDMTNHAQGLARLSLNQVRSPVKEGFGIPSLELVMEFLD